MVLLTEAPDPRLKSILDSGLADHNEEMARRRDWRLLGHHSAGPGHGELAGGLLGSTSMGLFFLDLFFLPKKLRGSGIGSQAEAEARSHGCRAATLVTVNFQAPEFYLRYGWVEFGRIASAPGVERIFMRKSLAA
jgi:GNAT superfamily N-acetyltransferase